ncbi:unnamed protein product [Leuciscus chuanchicus]
MAKVRKTGTDCQTQKERQKQGKDKRKKLNQWRQDRMKRAKEEYRQIVENGGVPQLRLLDGVIRVISIINRNSLQPLYCVYCSTEHDCRTVPADVQIHTDHFSFPYGASDVICKGKHMQNSKHVLMTTDKKDSVDPKMEYLPIRNKVARETFKFNFTICISNLFGDYNNVLQFAQTMEMYKLLGVQHVVIYKTKCGPDLEKLLKHYETEGILEIVSWPIDKFLNPSSGWNIETHKGDVHYYGQLVTLNECIYRHMYQSRYVLLNDIDEIIMPYKHTNLPSLMEDLQSAHPNVGVFLIENHIFPKTQFEDSGKFKRAEWNNIPGVNIMEHIYREPDRKNIYNPTKMIVNPRKRSGHSPRCSPEKLRRRRAFSGTSFKPAISPLPLPFLLRYPAPISFHYRVLRHTRLHLKERGVVANASFPKMRLLPSRSQRRGPPHPNAAARLLTNTCKHDHITPVLYSLHWLPVEFRIQFKILLFVFCSIHGLAPLYLCNMLTPYQPSRALRSSKQHLLVVPLSRCKKWGDRAFAVAGPKLWNALPLELRSIMDLPLFKTRLKHHLFSSAFDT